MQHFASALLCQRHLRDLRVAFASLDMVFMGASPTYSISYGLMRWEVLREACAWATHCACRHSLLLNERWLLRRTLHPVARAQAALRTTGAAMGMGNRWFN